MSSPAWTPVPDVVAGKWDDPDGADVPPFRCRWFFSWSELGRDRIAGFFAGYEGAGAFVEERFHASFADGVLTAFVWNGREHVAGADVSNLPLLPEVSACVDRHFDSFIEWHDRDRWEGGFLCLAAALRVGLVMLPNALFLPPAGDNRAMSRIAQMVRCTGILCRFPEQLTLPDVASYDG